MDYSKMSLEELLELRKKVINEHSKYKNFQLVRKISLNSAYGAIGAVWFRYYDTDIAESITLSGQVIIQWIGNQINKFLQKTLNLPDYDFVVAMDTDSVYLRLANLVQKFIPGVEDKDKICDFLNKAGEEILVPFMDQKFDEIAIFTNAYKNKMNMSREVIADKGIWTAKKRYILNVLDSEGVRLSKPKLKIMGIETTRSSTPESVREALKDAIKIIVSGENTDLHAFVSDFRQTFETLNPHEIAFPRGCNNMKKYSCKKNVYSLGCPIAVKGALLYNDAIKRLGLESKYETVKEGEKVKFIYLKEPNPLKTKVISFPDILPPEFDLAEYIDYEIQFDKAFLEPLRHILDVIDWTATKQTTLEDLFV